MLLRHKIAAKRAISFFRSLGYAIRVYRPMKISLSAFSNDKQQMKLLVLYFVRSVAVKQRSFD